MKVSLPLVGSFALYGCAVCACALGFLLLLTGAGWEPGAQVLAVLFSSDPLGWMVRVWAYLLAVPVLAMVVLAFLKPLFRETDVSEIRLDNEKGQVRLSASTISDYLQRKGSALKGVESIRVLVEGDLEAGKVAISVEASVNASEPLPVLTERLQSFIEEELRETIGLEKVEGIHIRFRKISGFGETALPAPDGAKAATGDAVDAETIEVEAESRGVDS